jgi:hypothetical protein
MVSVKLAVIDDIRRPARRVRQAYRDVAAAALAVPQDRPERDDARSADHQLQWSAVAGIPR